MEISASKTILKTQNTVEAVCSQKTFGVSKKQKEKVTIGGKDTQHTVSKTGGKCMKHS